MWDCTQKGSESLGEYFGVPPCLGAGLMSWVPVQVIAVPACLQVHFNGRHRAGHCLPKARPYVFVLLRKKCNEQRRSPVVGPSRLAVKDIVFRQQSKTVTFQLRSAGMRSILCAA